MLVKNHLVRASSRLPMVFGAYYNIVAHPAVFYYGSIGTNYHRNYSGEQPIALNSDVIKLTDNNFSGDGVDKNYFHLNRNLNNTTLANFSNFTFEPDKKIKFAKAGQKKKQRLSRLIFSKHSHGKFDGRHSNFYIQKRNASSNAAPGPLYTTKYTCQPKKVPKELEESSTGMEMKPESGLSPDKMEFRMNKYARLLRKRQWEKRRLLKLEEMSEEGKTSRSNRNLRTGRTVESGQCSSRNSFLPSPTLMDLKNKIKRHKVDLSKRPQETYRTTLHQISAERIQDRTPPESTQQPTHNKTEIAPLEINHPCPFLNTVTQSQPSNASSKSPESGDHVRLNGYLTVSSVHSLKKQEQNKLPAKFNIQNLDNKEEPPISYPSPILVKRSKRKLKVPITTNAKIDTSQLYAHKDVPNVRPDYYDFLRRVDSLRGDRLKILKKKESASSPLPMKALVEFRHRHPIKNNNSCEISQFRSQSSYKILDDVVSGYFKSGRKTSISYKPKRSFSLSSLSESISDLFGIFKKVKPNETLKRRSYSSSSSKEKKPWRSTTLNEECDGACAPALIGYVIDRERGLTPKRRKTSTKSPASEVKHDAEQTTPSVKPEDNVNKAPALVKRDPLWSQENVDAEIDSRLAKELESESQLLDDVESVTTQVPKLSKMPRNDSSVKTSFIDKGKGNEIGSGSRTFATGSELVKKELSSADQDRKLKKNETEDLGKSDILPKVKNDSKKLNELPCTETVFLPMLEITSTKEKGFSKINPTELMKAMEEHSGKSIPKNLQWPVVKDFLPKAIQSFPLKGDKMIAMSPPTKKRTEDEERINIFHKIYPTLSGTREVIVSVDTLQEENFPEKMYGREESKFISRKDAIDYFGDKHIPGKKQTYKDQRILSLFRKSPKKKLNFPQFSIDDTIMPTYDPILLQTSSEPIDFGIPATESKVPTFSIYETASEPLDVAANNTQNYDNDLFSFQHRSPYWASGFFSEQKSRFKNLFGGLNLHESLKKDKEINTNKDITNNRTILMQRHEQYINNPITTNQDKFPQMALTNNDLSTERDEGTKIPASESKDFSNPTAQFYKSVKLNLSPASCAASCSSQCPNYDYVPEENPSIRDSPKESETEDYSSEEVVNFFPININRIASDIPSGFDSGGSDSFTQEVCYCSPFISDEGYSSESVTLQNSYVIEPPPEHYARYGDLPLMMKFPQFRSKDRGDSTGQVFIYKVKHNLYKFKCHIEEVIHFIASFIRHVYKIYRDMVVRKTETEIWDLHQERLVNMMMSQPNMCCCRPPVQSFPSPCCPCRPGSDHLALARKIVSSCMKRSYASQSERKPLAITNRNYKEKINKINTSIRKVPSAQNPMKLLQNQTNLKAIKNKFNSSELISSTFPFQPIKTKLAHITEKNTANDIVGPRSSFLLDENCKRSPLGEKIFLTSDAMRLSAMKGLKRSKPDDFTFLSRRKIDSKVNSAKSNLNYNGFRSSSPLRTVLIKSQSKNNQNDMNARRHLSSNTVDRNGGNQLESKDNARSHSSPSIKRRSEKAYRSYADRMKK